MGKSSAKQVAKCGEHITKSFVTTTEEVQGKFSTGPTREKHYRMN